MSLREDFYDLAYELAQISNIKKDKIEARAKAIIESQNCEISIKIRKGLIKLKKNLMKVSIKMAHLVNDVT